MVKTVDVAFSVVRKFKLGHQICSNIYIEVSRMIIC